MLLVSVQFRAQMKLGVSKLLGGFFPTYYLLPAVLRFARQPLQVSIKDLE
jgi:hypothetical protein